MKQHYIWQEKEWPCMRWQDAELSKLLTEVNVLRGQLFGRLSMFGFEEKNESLLSALTQEIVHSAEIEGETLNHDSVRSSVARQLGLEYEGLPRTDHYVEGVVQVLMDATQNFNLPITSERLFGWHAALFPLGYSGTYKITVADWRQGEEPMQVVSGALGKQKVHYEAPISEDVPKMMEKFLAWINDDQNNVEPLIKAAVAHLWFVTIHPFDDGNGRLGRTISEALLSRADKTSQRYYSLSSVILGSRKEYYAHLEKAQKGDLDVTPWVEWFLTALKKALQNSLQQTSNVLNKIHFWERNRHVTLNERQRKVLNMLLDGFDGKLNSSKWYKINHCSQDTANRDINDLINKGILIKSKEGGRSTNYELSDES